MKSLIPNITFVYDRYKKATQTKPASVEMRITYDKKQRYISTGVQLLPKEWKNGRIINRPDALQLNDTINQLLTNTRRIIADMISKDTLDISLVIHKLKETNTDTITFMDFCKKRAEVRKYGNTPDSQKRYDRFINLFESWGHIIYFEDLTQQNIIRFDKFLIGRNLKTYSKWNNYHRFLNSFILDAINYGHIIRNPYIDLKIDTGKARTGIGRFLTTEEFDRIKTTPMPTECLAKVRDVFIFQVYTCLSYTDLRDFNADLIQYIKGMRVYTGNRKKTKKPYTIPIIDKAWNILVKYDYKLPVISNVKYNKYLKEIADLSHISKPISTHWARHTGATLLLNEGVPMEIISRICGHSSIKITEQVYAKLLDETVVETIAKFNL